MPSASKKRSSWSWWNAGLQKFHICLGGEAWCKPLISVPIKLDRLMLGFMQQTGHVVAFITHAYIHIHICICTMYVYISIFLYTCVCVCLLFKKRWPALETWPSSLRKLFYCQVVNALLNGSHLQSPPVTSPIIIHHDKSSLQTCSPTSNSHQPSITTATHHNQQ